MKDRGFKAFALFAILVMALGVTGAAFAAPTAAPPATAEGQCFGSPPDAKDEDGSDGWDIYAPDGFVFTEAMVKAGPDCYGNGELYSITGIGTNHVSAERLCEEGPECPGISHLEGNWEEVPPQEASVSVDPGACYWDGASYTDVVVNMTGEGTLTISGPGGPYVRTGDDTLTLTPGSYSWNFVPADGFELEGSGSGEFTVGECEPPPPGGASATLAPFCGGGVNVTLANAVIYIQFGDQDPVLIDENGSYPLDLGDYTAWAEAFQGFEFPEGATTQWEFSVDRCPTGHEEPPTGPLDSIPLSTALPIAASGLTGLALLGSALRRKRH